MTGFTFHRPVETPAAATLVARPVAAAGSNYRSERLSDDVEMRCFCQEHRAVVITFYYGTSGEPARQIPHCEDHAPGGVPS